MMTRPKVKQTEAKMLQQQQQSEEDEEKKEEWGAATSENEIWPQSIKSWLEQNFHSPEESSGERTTGGKIHNKPPLTSFRNVTTATQQLDRRRRQGQVFFFFFFVHA